MHFFIKLHTPSERTRSFEMLTDNMKTILYLKELSIFLEKPNIFRITCLFPKFDKIIYKGTHCSKPGLSLSKLSRSK